MKFKDCKYAQQFFDKALQLGCIKEEQREEVMEQEGEFIESCGIPSMIVVWSEAGLVGEMLRNINAYDDEYSARLNNGKDKLYEIN